MSTKETTSFAKSVQVALAGVWWNIRHERNMRLHLLALVMVAALGFYFHLSAGEWLVIVVFFALVPAVELLNSAVELTCDIVRDQLELDYAVTRWPRDLAAGAVLWASGGAVVAGLIVFVPKVMALLT